MGDLEASHAAAMDTARYRKLLDWADQHGDFDGGRSQDKKATVQEPEPGWITTMGRAVARGGLHVISQVGGFAAGMGRAGELGLTGALAPAGELWGPLYKKYGQAVAQWATHTAENIPKTDKRQFVDEEGVHLAPLLSPKWWAEGLAEAAPGLAVMFVPGMLATKIALADTTAALTLPVLRRLALIGAKIAPRLLHGLPFGMAEFGGTYNEVKARGGSDDEALKAATGMGFIATGAMAVNLHHVLGEGGGIARRAGRGALTQNLVNFAINGPRGAILGDDVWKTLADTVNQIPVASVSGAALGAFAGGKTKPNDPPPPEGAASESQRPTDDPRYIAARKSMGIVPAELEQHARIATVLAAGANPKATPERIAVLAREMMPKPPPPEAPVGSQPASAGAQAEVGAIRAQPDRTIATPTGPVRPLPEDHPNFGLLKGFLKESMGEKEARAAAAQIITENPDADMQGLLKAAMHSPAEMAKKVPPKDSGSKDEPRPVDVGGDQSTTTRPEFSLSRELSGAKPRYGFKGDNYELNFESDLDRALYILAQEKKSARDADYLKSAMEHTGLSEEELRAQGREVRARVKELVRGSDVSETVTIPKTKPKDVVSRETQQGVPAFITKNVEQGLADLGYNRQEINAMAPEEAQRLLKSEEGPQREPLIDRLTDTQQAILDEVGRMVEAESRTIDPARTVTPGEPPMAGEPPPPTASSFADQPPVSEPPQPGAKPPKGPYLPGFKNVPIPQRQSMTEMATDINAEALRQVQRRGVVPDAEMDRLATEAIESGSITAEKILEWEPGTIVKGEDVLAAKRITAAAVQFSNILRQRALQGIYDPQAALEAWALAKKIARNTSAVASEYGRGFRGLKSEESPPGTKRDIKDILPEWEC